MSIIEAASVDAMSINNEEKILTLFIEDDIVWIDGEMSVEEHIQHLQKKINAYIRFLNAKEHLKVYPEAEEYTPCIYAEFQYRVPFDVEDAFQKLGDDLKAKGIKFEYSILQVI